MFDLIMELTLVYGRAAVVIFIFVLLQTKGGFTQLLSGTFKIISTSGQRVQIYKSTDGTKNQCALTCLNNIVSSQVCLAFHWDVNAERCDLYTKGTTQVPDPGVEAFWFQDRDVFHTLAIGDNKYSIYVSSTKKKFRDARSHCQSLGGYLLEFDSLEEVDAVQKIIAFGYEPFIIVGVNDIAKEGVWVTDREGKVMDTSIYRWNTGEPNTAWENCGTVIPHNMRINNGPCSYKYIFLCEKDL